MDTRTPEARSRNMSRVRSTDTRPEFVLRSLLHRAGFRFRLKRADLPGHPDLTLPRHRCVIFVHGCFWHRHQGCKRATMPATHREKWALKFEKNVRRDAEVRAALEALGWKVLVVWECELMKDPELTVQKLIEKIGHKRSYLLPEKREILKAAEEKFQMKFKS